MEKKRDKYDITTLPAVLPAPTLSLQPRPHQGEGVGGNLATGGGHGATAGDNKHRGVGVLRVVVHVGLLQRLVHGEVDAGVGDDAQQVGDVASVEGPQTFSLVDLLGGISNILVLAGFS